MSGEPRQPRPGGRVARARDSGWGAVIALGCVIVAACVWPMAASVREPGPDSRLAGYAFLGSLLVEALVVGLWATRVWVRVLGLLAAGLCAFAICVAALANMR